MSQQLTPRTIWTLANETFQALAPSYQVKMYRVIGDSGLGQNFFPIFLVRGFYPEPFSVEKWHLMAPYAAKSRLRENLEQMRQLGLLEKTGDDAYQLTDYARQAIEQVFGEAAAQIADIEVLDVERTKRLAGYLERIVKATLASDEVQRKSRIRASRWTQPDIKSTPPVALADQYLTDLFHFRDDAHISAWLSHDVSGQQWEVLTLVWREQANTAEALAEQIPNHGYSAEEYAAALQSLVEKGWLEEQDGIYQVTEQGRQVREAAEEETDRLFYIGWNALSENELADMAELLTEIRAELLAKNRRLVVDRMSETMHAHVSLFIKPFVDYLKETGFVNGTHFVMHLAEKLEPAPLRLDDLIQTAPYSNPEGLAKKIERTVELGGLEKVDDGYRLTEKGRQVIAHTDQIFQSALAEQEINQQPQLENLVTITNRLVQGSLSAEQPTEKPHLSRLEEKVTAEMTPLVQVDLYITSLFYFRDDAHVAAWRSVGLNAIAQEALTYVWQGKAHTAADLVAKLAHRGYTVDDYAAALERLTQKGWLKETDGHFALTEAGRQVREEIEQKTDEIFFSPWQELSVAEVNTLFRGLDAIITTIRQQNADALAEKYKDLFPITQQLGQKLNPLYRDKINPLVTEGKLGNWFNFISVWNGLQLAPEPFNGSDIVARFPYGTGAAWVERLANAAEAGFLKKVDGGYVVTDEGRAAVNEMNDVFYRTLGELNPLPEEELEKLAGYLKRLVEASIASPPVEGYQHVVNAQKVEPSTDYPALARIDHYCDCLNAYRDDSHLPTFQSKLLSGHGWEAFTFLVRGEVEEPTAAAIAEKVNFRGHDAAAYTEALAEYVRRGWLEEQNGRYSVTEAGREMREEAERLTDRNFYGPWAALAEEEVEEVRDLFNRLFQKLAEMQPEPVEA
jgi:DNA-binding MarR family transcriptional regulator/Mn-dependent DtxR family transcriptional regulator